MAPNEKVKLPNETEMPFLALGRFVSPDQIAKRRNEKANQFYSITFLSAMSYGANRKGEKHYYVSVITTLTRIRKHVIQN